jgi:NADPH:quinone reductase-like Zn-dependent oxidoreductase
MLAVVQTGYGPPEVLAPRELETPSVADDGVLVRLRATSVNTGSDRRHRRLVRPAAPVRVAAPEDTGPGNRRQRRRGGRRRP